MNKIFVKPAEGLKVPLPRELQVNGAVYLAPEGQLMDDCNWWHKLARAKDVAISASAPTAPKETPRVSAKGE